MICPEFITVDFICTAMEALYDLQQSTSWQVLSTVGVILLGFASIARGVFSYLGYRAKKRDIARHVVASAGVLVKAFQDIDFIEAQRGYIKPDCSDIDPSEQDDLRHTVGARESAFDVVERLLSTKSKVYVLVLADSGMGKTTFLLNLAAHEIGKPSKKKLRMAIVPLGESGALEHIKSIPDQRNTVILLDAFDEDVEAIDDAAARMKQLMATCANFKAVVMTCRTQFFPSDGKVPRNSGVKIVTARRAGVPTFYQWKALYLQPFDEGQIESFIKNTISFVFQAKRNRARKIVAEISDLAARPMLLALVPELASSNEKVHGLWDLYAFMIDKWLERERGWIDPSLLLELSSKLAVDLVLNRNSRGGERIPLKEISSVLELTTETIEAWKLTTRSLLNRDSLGNYKFAHRSILEFLFIRALVQGENRCLTVMWTDMMKQLFLSWGYSDQRMGRAPDILRMDLRATTLFPLVERRHPSVNIDSAWAKEILSSNAGHGAISSFPMAWRAEVGHIKEHGDLIRVYDLADGLIWQIEKTTHLSDREERQIFKVDRFACRGDGAEDCWMVPELFEMRRLVEILSLAGKLEQVLDHRELYWLADTDGYAIALVRVRGFSAASSGVASYPGLTVVHSGLGGSGNSAFAIDVYRAEVRGTRTASVLALPIMTFQGDVEPIWHGDSALGAPLDWVVTKVGRFDVVQKRKRKSRKKPIASPLASP